MAYIVLPVLRADGFKSSEDVHGPEIDVVNLRRDENVSKNPLFSEFWQALLGGNLTIATKKFHEATEQLENLHHAFDAAVRDTLSDPDVPRSFHNVKEVSGNMLRLYERELAVMYRQWLPRVTAYLTTGRRSP